MSSAADRLASESTGIASPSYDHFVDNVISVKCSGDPEATRATCECIWPDEDSSCCSLKSKSSAIGGTCNVVSDSKVVVVSGT